MEELCFSYPFGDRLQPDLEQVLFERGLFKALFGIGGFSRRGVSNEKLERAGVEGAHIGWTVFGGSILARLRRNRGAKAVRACFSMFDR